MVSRTTYLLAITVYLILLGVALSFVDVQNTLGSTIDEKGIGDYNFPLETNISSMPTIINTIFIYIPIALWLILVVWSIYPTGNAGA